MKREFPGCIWHELEPLLHEVQRPSRYVGGEPGCPDIEPGGVGFVFSYPDIYEIGVSNLGIAVLQEVVNGLEGAFAERAFSPWVDMEALMRKHEVPLFTLETHRPVGDFDLFGISLPHELSFTNVLNLIDMAGIPLRSSDRNGGPVVVGGGPGVANPEPLADFFDLFVLGEGEDVVVEMVEVVSRGKSEKWGRTRLLDELARLRGVYRPSAYRVNYGRDGRVDSVVPLEGYPGKVAKRLVDLDRWVFPREPIIPICEAVHDRLNVELFRGCTRGCRFCQAGMIYRPVRERSAENVVEVVRRLAGATGHDEVSLCSLSSTDYTRVDRVAAEVSGICRERDMTLSLPSLRMDGMSVELASGLEGSDGGGITFAPEAGTKRLRKIINKPLSEDCMIDAVVSAVREGRRRVKLYFMIGLPTETEEDVRAISVLVRRLRNSVKAEGLQPPSFNVSVSTFVPKPHTPFQRSPLDRIDEITWKQDILKDTLRIRGVRFSWHDREMSTVEGLLSRGDRRLSMVVEGAWRSGARFDSWSEHFVLSRWLEALEEAGLELEFYCYRGRGEHEVFPWDHLDFGIDRGFLNEEFTRAKAVETTPDCREGTCTGCGVCERLGAELVLRGGWGC